MERPGAPSKIDNSSILTKAVRLKHEVECVTSSSSTKQERKWASIKELTFEHPNIKNKSPGPLGACLDKIASLQICIRDGINPVSATNGAMPTRGMPQLRPGRRKRASSCAVDGLKKCDSASRCHIRYVKNLNATFDQKFETCAQRLEFESHHITRA